MSSSKFGVRYVVISLVVLVGLVTAAHRGAANAPPGRFTVTNGGMPIGTVLDTMTGLIWQQAVPATAYTWADAGAYCTSNTGQLPNTGWRLPSMQELQTIVDDNQMMSTAVDSKAFPNTPSDGFWTSSSYKIGTSNAWFVNFFDGGSSSSATTSTYRVRCVR